MANINVSYDEIRTTAQRLLTGREELTQKLQELRSVVDNLVSAGFVTDQASKAFDSSYQQFTTGATQTVSGLEGLSTYLTNAANTLEQTDQQLSAGL
ncbi:WXG100 family type VII secretion target [Plantibacter sp. Mn2098]|uniref:WXG100 family type VII secretion target n=1 Tax=Plantibacter sp. Mn2098 TaxID=3395266 RepID=UPI003BC4CC66